MNALLSTSVFGWTTDMTTGSRLIVNIVDPANRYYQKIRRIDSQSSSCLYNVPPPAETDRESYVTYASKQSPPSSFFELQKDCIRAIRMARADNMHLQEVEYPPLPAAVMEMDDVSAYEVSAANINLALETAKGLLLADDTIQKIAILLPDEAELNFAIEKVTASANPIPGVVVSSLRSSDPNDDRIFKPEQLLLGLFGGGSGGAVKTIPNTDVYLCLTASTQELPDIEELMQLIEQEKTDGIKTTPTTVICYNLKLDVLRGDLGAPAFPSKELHDRFLSRIKPVYYLRTRQYSRNTSRPPFLVNYQGCLFRSYPGQYQTLLDTGTGSYRRLCGSSFRPSLGEFKEQLTNALKQQGVLPEEGQTLGFLRTGYKITTWWEEERIEASDNWRT
jgi:hypothetical protein